MKKILHIFLFVLILTVGLCISASAADIDYVDDNAISWRVSITDFQTPLAYGDVTAHGSATIKSINVVEYTKDGFHMPSFIKYDGKTYVVTAIADNAFKGSNLVFGNVTFPSYLNKIGSYAFYRTRIYGDLVFPSTLTSLGEHSFNDCRGILSVKLPAGIDTIPNSAFYRCQSLVKVEAPASIKYFKNNCFSYCLALQSVPLGTGTLEVGSQAFISCKAIESVDLTSVTTLSSEAFKDCLTLEKVTFPVTLDYSSSVFTNCVSLKKFIVPSGATKLAVEDGVLYNKDKTTIYRCPPNNKISSIIIPDSVKTISADAFYNVTTLTRVKVGSGVTSIGNNAFRNTSVFTFYIPDTVTSLGTYVLADCPELTWVVIGSRISSASSIVSSSKNVKLVIGKSPSFSTSGTGIPTTGKAYSMATYVCTTHFYDAEYFDEEIKATCTASGIDICLACGDQIYAKPLGHTGAIIETSELSCTTDEYVVIDCTRCGEHEAKTVYQKAQGHIGKKITVPATASAAGYTAISCTNCSQVIIDGYSASLYLVGDINNDKAIDKNDVDLLGKYIGGATIKINKLACDLNQDKMVDIYDLLLLKRFVEKLDTTIAPADTVCEKHINIVTKNHTSSNTADLGCDGFAISVSYCGDCGTLISTSVTNPEGHDWKHTKGFTPTCTSTGFDTYKCDDCGATKQDFHPMVEHSGAWWTMSSKKGYQYRNCDVCGLFENRVVDYSVFDDLMGQIAKNYTVYYNKETLSLLAPIIENYNNTALTQEQVDQNVAQLKEFLPRIQYVVTDVPTIFITTDGVTSLVRNMDYTWAEIAVAWYDENGSYFDLIETNGEMRVRGNSTADKNKKPYNIKFSTEVDLLGLGKDDKYCLLANYCEPSFIRNALVRELNKMILPDYTSDYRFVDVYCNGNYMGAYMLTTPADIEETRVDLDDNDEFILEIEYDAGDVKDNSALYFQTPYTNFRIKIDSHDIKDITSDGYASLYSTILQAEFAVMSGDWEQIQKYFDVESLAKYYILHEYFKDVDYAWDSTKFTIDNGKISAGPLWDFDRALGHANKSGGNADCRDAYHNSTKKPSVGGVVDDSTTGTWANLLYNGIPNENWINDPVNTSKIVNENSDAYRNFESKNWDRQNGNHNWFTFLYMYSPEFMDLVADYIWEYQDELKFMYADIYDDLGNKKQNFIDELYYDEDLFNSLRRNFTKWGIVSEEGQSFKSFKEAQEALRTWLQGRHEWMLEFYCGKQMAVSQADEILLSKSTNSYYKTTTTKTEELDGVLIYEVRISSINSADVEKHATDMYNLIIGGFDVVDDYQIEFYYNVADGKNVVYIDGEFAY